MANLASRIATVADTMIRSGLRGELVRDEPLFRHTSLRVGGQADLYLVPADQEDLLLMVRCLTDAALPWMVIGGGYNLLVRDGGIPGAVISLKQLNRLERLADDRIIAEAGVSNGQLVRFCLDEELAGLEFLCGIPGTVGGALCMNAGAHGGVIIGALELLRSARDGVVTETPRSELSYGYRYLALQPGEIILGGRFQLSPLPKAELAKRIGEYQQYRREHQRVTDPNAGSFFKNPPGDAAWRLIDGAGLKGTRVGGAKVAEEHANFLVNAGGATAADFLELAAMVKAAVWERFGVPLEEEVRIIGVDDRDQAQGQ
jgi:UDP-N-acetylmuramate dehydrogenase